MCGKTYSSASTLSRHRRTHAGKNISCEVCGKSFSRKDRLKDHQRSHFSKEKRVTPGYCQSVECVDAVLRQARSLTFTQQQHGVDPLQFLADHKGALRAALTKELDSPLGITFYLCMKVGFFLSDQ